MSTEQNKKAAELFWRFHSAAALSHAIHLDAVGSDKFPLHKLLDELYSSLPGYADTFIETYSGLHPEFRLSDFPASLTVEGLPGEGYGVALYLRDWLINNQELLTPPEDEPDVQNVLLDIAGKLLHIGNLLRKYG